MVCGSSARRCQPRTPQPAAANSQADQYLQQELAVGSSRESATAVVAAESPSTIDLDADWLRKLASPDDSTLVQKRTPDPGDTATQTSLPPNDSPPAAAPAPEFAGAGSHASQAPRPPLAPEPQPIVAGRAVFGRAKLSLDPIELLVEGGIHAKHFDYSRGRLVIQHERRGIERLSAWSLDDWRPVDPSLGFDPVSISHHELAASLGPEREYALEIVRSTTNPSGSFWKVAVSEPSRGFGVDRRRIQLIWDMTRGQWVGGIEARDTDDTHFHMGGRHLVMTGGQGAKSLRILPWADGSSIDLGRPLSEKQLGPGPLSLAFAPDDSYVVAQRGPMFLPDHTLREPLHLTALQPESAEPTWERSYAQVAGLANTSWQCLGTWLSPQSELLGVVLTREPQARFLLCDLATGKQVAAPILCRTRLKMAVAVSPRHGLAVFLREPNILEVWQFGVATPLLQINFDVTHPGSTGRVGALLCPEGRYLAVHFTDRPLMLVYRIAVDGEPLELSPRVDEALCPPTKPILDDSPRRKPTQEPVTLLSDSATFSIDHLIDGPVEPPAAEEPRRRRRTRKQRSGLQPLELLTIWLIVSVMAYILSVGPVAAYFPHPPPWLLQCYAPHRMLASHARVANALRNWCGWWRATDEAYAVYFGVKLVAYQEEESPAETPASSSETAASAPPNSSTELATNASSAEDAGARKSAVLAPPATQRKEVGPNTTTPNSNSAAAAAASATLPPASAVADDVAEPSVSTSQTTPADSVGENAAPPEVRLWTDKYGRRVEAVLVRVEQNEVIFELPNGQFRKTLISRLSAEDQEYLRKTQGRASASARNAQP
ncbi:MAG: hypothetical protein U1A77_13995 [Pirellulales bacterium]